MTQNDTIKIYISYETGYEEVDGSQYANRADWYDAMRARAAEPSRQLSDWLQQIEPNIQLPTYEEKESPFTGLEMFHVSPATLAILRDTQKRLKSIKGIDVPSEGPLEGFELATPSVDQKKSTDENRL